MAADNEILFTVKGKENLKGAAHRLFTGGMITGKRNWIGRQRLGCLSKMTTAYMLWSCGFALGNFEVTLVGAGLGEWG